MASSGNKLMEEIYDQFLVCKICYEIYKSPKTLSCLHTFCADCLEKHQDAELERSYRYLLYSRPISCPICRKKTEIPPGGVRRLPDNFLVDNLSDILNRRKANTDAPQCEICIPNNPRAPHSVRSLAVSKCLDCSKVLCKNCVELHKKTKVTQGHGLFDIDVEKEIECKSHKDEVVRFYCEPCEMCICVVCTFQEHKGHDVSSFTEGIEKYRTSLDGVLIRCRERIAGLKEQLHLIDQCEKQMKTTEEEIRDMAINSISVIRRKEKEMMHDLYEAFGDETLDFIKEKGQILENLENLQSTCNLTDIFLKDKSIELLLLKKEIQEKLNILLQRNWGSQAEKLLAQQVKFVPGNFAFGYLDTGDKEGNGTNQSRGIDDKVDGEPLKGMNDDLVKKYYSIPSMDNDTQTDMVDVCDSSTTMGKAITDFCRETLTQTDTICQTRDTSSDNVACTIIRPSMRTKCTMVHPITRDRHTMTVGLTPTMKRKIQTEIINTTDQTTSTPKRMFISSADVNTQTYPDKAKSTVDRSTLTMKTKLCHALTETIGLTELVHQESNTVTPSFECTGTVTDSVLLKNKGTLTTKATQKDKLTSTPRLIFNTQHTNTPTIHRLDMGVSAKIYGDDKNIGTRTIVSSDTGVGDGKISSIHLCSAASEETAKEFTDKATVYDIEKLQSSQGVMTDQLSGVNQETYTEYFNMVDGSTEMPHKDYKTVSSATIQLTHMEQCTNTENVTCMDKGIHVDEIKPVEKAKTLDSLCQTVITLIDAILVPNLTPCHKTTNTISAEYVDKDMGTESIISTDQATYIDLQELKCQMKDSETNTHLTELVETGSETIHVHLNHMECNTEVHEVQDFGMNTSYVELKDSSHDAYRGNLCDANTNTDLDIVVKRAVKLVDASMCTEEKGICEASTGTELVLTASKMTETPQALPMKHKETNTKDMHLIDSTTSMQSSVYVTEVGINVVPETNESSCATASMSTSEIATETERVTLVGRGMATEATAMDSKSVETTRCQMINTATGDLNITMVDTSSDPIPMDTTDSETNTPHFSYSSVSVGTIPIISSSKMTSTETKETKDCGSHTFVQNIEKATYMPQTVIISRGTSTPVTLTSEKKSNTTEIDQVSMGTMTPTTRRHDQETTMGRFVESFESSTNTRYIEKTDSQNDPIPIHQSSTGTNTIIIDLQNTGTSPYKPYERSASTTTQHIVTSSDQASGTPVVEHMDQYVATEIVQRNKDTMTHIVTRNVGVLKRPHTLTRGTSTVHTVLLDCSTSPDQPFIADQGTMTTNQKMADKCMSVKPFGLITASTSMSSLEITETSTSMPDLTVTSRCCSPIHVEYTERASSPIHIPQPERETSPIRFKTNHKRIGVKPTTSECFTSMTRISMKNKETTTEHHEMVNRDSSPVRLLFEKHMADHSTGMPPPVGVNERASSPIRIPGKNKGTLTQKAKYSTTGTDAVHKLFHDQGVLATVPMLNKIAATPSTKTVNMSTGMKHIYMTESGTTMPYVAYIEKETSMPQIHLMHKNVSTDNIMMEDKQTATFDISAAYRDLVAPPTPITLCRGTNTPEYTTATKETSPPRFSNLVDRGSSPVKVVMISKGISVRRGQILEPEDKYHSAGGQSKPNKPIADSPKPKLASIQEDDSEPAHNEMTSSLTLSSSGSSASSPLFLLSPPRSPKLISPPKSPRFRPIGLGMDRVPSSLMMHKEKFTPSLIGRSEPRGNGSTFSFQGTHTPSNILWKVEMGTNTPEVNFETKGTSTPPVETQDKAMCTEAITIDNKMAACINKLKTVRQRLEAKQDGPQPVYSQASGFGTLNNPMLNPTPITVQSGSKTSLLLPIRSKSVGESLNEGNYSPFASPVVPRKTSASLANTTASETSSDSSEGKYGEAQIQHGLARKKRLDISQLLRSASLPENDASQLCLTNRPKIHAVQPQVIPRLNVESIVHKPKSPRPRRTTSPRSKLLKSHSTSGDDSMTTSSSSSSSSSSVPDQTRRRLHSTNDSFKSRLDQRKEKPERQATGDDKRVKPAMPTRQHLAGKAEAHQRSRQKHLVQGGQPVTAIADTGPTTEPSYSVRVRTRSKPQRELDAQQIIEEETE